MCSLKNLRGEVPQLIYNLSTRVILELIVVPVGGGLLRFVEQTQSTVRTPPPSPPPLLALLEFNVDTSILCRKL